MTDRGRLAILVGATLLAYATAHATAFQFDDFHTVADNASVRSLAAWIASLPTIRPLTAATYALNRTFSDAPGGFVAVGLACHVVGVILAWHLVRRWLPGLAPRVQDPSLAALVAALVFALHPAQTEAVTYVTGRSTVLSGCLYLAALVAWERARLASAKRWTALSVALFAFALAARETVWTLPFAIVLLEAARGAGWKRALQGAAPHFAVLALAAAAVLSLPAYRHLLASSLATRGPVANLAAQVEGIGYLVSHPLLTLRVNIDPDLAAPDEASVRLIATAALLLGAATLGAWQLRRRPWLGVGVLWFFLQLLPGNSLVARFDLANDRQLYLALLGPALVIGVVLGSIRGRATVRLIALALMALLGTATLVRNADYRSELALWSATVRASPGKARAWNNLGYAHQLAGNFGEARAAYAHALALDPGYLKARLNLDRLGPPQPAALD